MITPSQISESIGVPASTVRRWAAEFENHLSPRKGKKRTYTPADLDTFRRIKELSAAGFSLKKIHDQLSVVETPPDQSSVLMTLTDFTRAIESARGEVVQLRQKIDQQEDRIKRLEEYLSLPWYRRIGKKPPASEK